ncbi:MAG: response regulator [candidate division KSB1 bacterium]|nr:response regulator [candidate division KSB1 bacterium]
MKILIVDDDRISLSLMSRILNNSGYQTLEASSAKQAIEYLESNEPVGLIISDIMMPDMSGLEFLNYLRKKPGFMNLPVIMCSAQKDEKSVVQAIQLGINDYVLKPIDAYTLLSRVEKVFKNEIPALADKYRVMTRLRMDVNTYQKMVATLINGILAEIEKMQEYLRQGDFERLKLWANSIKGSADNLGAQRISIVMQGMEEAAEKQDANRVQGLLIELQRELNILREIAPGYEKMELPKKQEDKPQEQAEKPEEPKEPTPSQTEVPVEGDKT